jgi:hypothetical protein
MLASEGGVCGKFNLSNCFLQIDDEGKVIQEITEKMRKLDCNVTAFFLQDLEEIKLLSCLPYIGFSLQCEFSHVIYENQNQ